MGYRINLKSKINWEDFPNDLICYIWLTIFGKKNLIIGYIQIRLILFRLIIILCLDWYFNKIYVKIHFKLIQGIFFLVINDFLLITLHRDQSRNFVITFLISTICSPQSPPSDFIFAFRTWIPNLKQFWNTKK